MLLLDVKIGARLVIVLALASLLGSCGNLWKKGEPWSFALTRDILDRDPSPSGGWDRSRSCDDNTPSSSTFHGGVEDLWVLAIFCLPSAIDLALLPVTGLHDLYVD